MAWGCPMCWSLLGRSICGLWMMVKWEFKRTEQHKMKVYDKLSFLSHPVFFFFFNKSLYYLFFNRKQKNVSLKRRIFYCLSKRCQRDSKAKISSLTTAEAIKIFPFLFVLPSIFHLGSEGAPQGMRDNVPASMFVKVRCGDSLLWGPVTGGHLFALQAFWGLDKNTLNIMKMSVM